jgi:hypothetical protein
MEMPPCWITLRVTHRAWKTLRVSHITTSLSDDNSQNFFLSVLFKKAATRVLAIG